MEYIQLFNSESDIPSTLTDALIGTKDGKIKIVVPVPEPTQPNNELWYTTSDGNTIDNFENTGCFGNDLELVSNTYEDGKGIAKYSGDVTTIGYSAFYNCSGLTSITIGSGVTSIDDYAFYVCSSLTSITIPDSVTTIGQQAFYDCSGLTSINIPDSVTSIGIDAFAGCTGLTSVTIGNGVTSIGYCAFEYCTGLTSINIPDSVTSISECVFGGCSGLTSINIPDSVTSIDDYAFEYCTGLTSINIPDSVTTIGNYAFQYCSGLTSVTIPNSVTYIGSNAFHDCTGLTSVTIPNNLSNFGENVFGGCSNLRSVNGYTSIIDIFNNVTKRIQLFDKSNSNWSVGSMFDSNSVNVYTIHYTTTDENKLNINDCFDEYNCITDSSHHTYGNLTAIINKNMSIHDDYNIIKTLSFESGVTSISLDDLENCTSVTVPHSITNIKLEYMFQDVTLNYNGTTEEFEDIEFRKYDCGTITVVCTDGTITK